MSDTLKAVVRFLPHWIKNARKLWQIQPVEPLFSFSECGEDAMVIRYLRDIRQIHKGIYIDIGANSPVQGNNTMSMYLEGWRGVIVEPNPSMIPGYKRIRPGDTIVQKVVSSKDHLSLTFYEMEPNLVSTLNPDVVAYHEKIGYRLIRESQVESISLNTLCGMFNEPVHFVSIDTEGHEYEILSTFDFNRFKPMMFCLETVMEDEAFLENSIALLEKNGYEIYGKTGKNTLLIRKENN